MSSWRRQHWTPLTKTAVHNIEPVTRVCECLLLAVLLIQGGGKNVLYLPDVLTVFFKNLFLTWLKKTRCKSLNGERRGCPVGQLAGPAGKAGQPSWPGWLAGQPASQPGWLAVRAGRVDGVFEAARLLLYLGKNFHHCEEHNGPDPQVRAEGQNYYETCFKGIGITNSNQTFLKTIAKMASNIQKV